MWQKEFNLLLICWKNIVLPTFDFWVSLWAFVHDKILCHLKSLGEKGFIVRNQRVYTPCQPIWSVSLDSPITWLRTGRPWFKVKQGMTRLVQSASSRSAQLLQLILYGTANRNLARSSPRAAISTTSQTFGTSQTGSSGDASCADEEPVTSVHENKCTLSTLFSSIIVH